MSNNICIVQPGNIGDIIICLPIAKHFHERGFNVKWFVWEHIHSHFNKGHVDYVDFFSINTAHWYDNVLKTCDINDWTVVDLCFTQHGCWHNTNTTKYQQQNTMSFDQFKYKLADVDFENKWTLDLTRDMEREKKLNDRIKINDHDKICLFSDVASDTHVNVKLDLSNYSGRVVRVESLTDCVFDWLGAFETCDRFVLIESCFSNLLDQLNMVHSKCVLLPKKGYYGDVLIDDRHKGMPVLRGDWQVLN